MSTSVKQALKHSLHTSHQHLNDSQHYSHGEQIDIVLIFLILKFLFIPLIMTYKKLYKKLKSLFLDTFVIETALLLVKTCEMTCRL